VTFLSPLFLLGAAAAVVPIVVHLLKREPEPRVKFAAVRLLKQAPVEHTEKHRLRELLLLALRVATLVLLALAFARPFFPGRTVAGAAGTTLIALDTSFSMGAPGRFARARQLAKDAIGRAAAGEMVGVLTFDDRAILVAKPSADRVLALSAVDEAAPAFGGTRYRAALAAAGQAVAAAGRQQARIVIVTDLQESGWDEGDRVGIPDYAKIEIADVGAPPPNVAVTDVRVDAERVVATIHNTGRTRDVRARLRIDDRSSAEAVASVGEHQSADVNFPGAPHGQVAAVSIDDPDGVPADDVRYVRLDGSHRPTVLVVSGSGNAARDAFYLQHALESGGSGGRAFEVASTSGAQLSAESADRQRATGVLRGRAAVVLVSTRGLERRGREALAEYVRGGGGLLIAAGPDVDGLVAADVLGGAASLQISHVPAPRLQARALAPVDVRHPIFRPFTSGAASLALVRFRDAARIAADGCHTVARFTNGDRALLECSAGDGRALILASDLDNRWNDFPLHASFVPFVHEAVRYLASARSVPSDYLVGDAPAGVPPTPGVYLIHATQNGEDRRVTVNVDTRESQSGRLTSDEFQTAVRRIKQAEQPSQRIEAAQQEDNQHLWQYALALMVITLTLEGIIASRTA
jgi:hypothetical protein